MVDKSAMAAAHTALIELAQGFNVAQQGSELALGDSRHLQIAQVAASD